MKINITLITFSLLFLTNCKDDSNSKILVSNVTCVEDNFLNRLVITDENGIELSVYLDSSKNSIEEIKIYQNKKYIGHYFTENGVFKNTTMDKDEFIIWNYKAIVSPYLYEKKIVNYKSFSDIIDSLSAHNKILPNFSEHEKDIMYKFWSNKWHNVVK